MGYNPLRKYRGAKRADITILVATIVVVAAIVVATIAGCPTSAPSNELVVSGKLERDGVTGDQSAAAAKDVRGTAYVGTEAPEGTSANDVRTLAQEIRGKIAGDRPAVVARRSSMAVHRLLPAQDVIADRHENAVGNEAAGDRRKINQTGVKTEDGRGECLH